MYLKVKNIFLDTMVINYTLVCKAAFSLLWMEKVEIAYLHLKSLQDNVRDWD